MGYEILTPRLLAPAFGSSLYVWGCSLVFTMAGLATGYYFSSRVTEKALLSRISGSLLIAMFLLLLLTFTSDPLNDALLSMNLKPGIVLSSFLHLFPVLLLLGMVSPLLISALKNERSHGKNTGIVFGASTLSGIAFSLFTGFYLIPEQGLFITGLFLSFTLIPAILITLNALRKRS